MATVPSTLFSPSSSGQHALRLKAYITGLENSKGLYILLGREEEKEILEGFLEKVTPGWVLKNGLEMDSREAENKNLPKRTREKPLEHCRAQGGRAQ